MSQDADIRIIHSFESLPLWQGPQEKPGPRAVLPFTLAWDSRGFLRQMIDPDMEKRIVEAYGEESYQHITLPPGASAWSTRLGEEHLGFVSDHCDLGGRSILEIGAGSLFIAERLMQSADISRYTAIDPTLHHQRPNDPGIEVIADYFGPDFQEGRVYETVFAFHCLEHVPDPVAFLQQIREVLSGPDGDVVLSVPDVEPYLREGSVHPYIHEHISYLTRETVETVFACSGFEIDASEVANDTMTFRLRPLGAPTSVVVEPSDSILSIPERIQSAMSKAESSIKDAIASGMEIAIHGATPGSNNFFHLAAFPGYDRIHIFDGDDKKTGLFIPAFPKPILHSSDARYSKMDRVYIAATSFYDEIAAGVSQNHGIGLETISPLF